jgi:SAM-dependent methyltransferase
MDVGETPVNTCPICTAADSLPVRHVQDYTLRYCGQCDLIWAHPMRSPGPAWYEQHQEYLKNLLLGLDFLAWNHKQFLRDLPGRGGRLLDVGCGSGRFLARASALGYVVTGLDFNPVAVQVARSRFGLLDVHCTSLQEFRTRNPHRYFDVVTAFEVLEHVEDPRGFLQTVFDLLRPGGFLALSVPFRDRWPRFGVHDALDLPPHHLTWWSKRAITEALRRTELRVRHIRTGWMIGEEIILAKVRFGVTDRLFRSAQRSGNQPVTLAQVATIASRLMRIKRLLARLAAIPLDVTLRTLGATGMDMYVLAQRP